MKIYWKNGKPHDLATGGMIPCKVWKGPRELPKPPDRVGEPAVLLNKGVEIQNIDIRNLTGMSLINAASATMGLVALGYIKAVRKEKSHWIYEVVKEFEL